MSQSNLDREAINIRFRANMRRLAAITVLLHSNKEELKPTGIFRSEGVRADLLRFVVVFLHATAEDFVRNHIHGKGNKKKFTLSQSKLNEALSRIKVDKTLFEDIIPGLTQLATRRHQIVHHADLTSTQSEDASTWDIADDWKLIHWHLVVSAFYYRLRKATGPTGVVEDRASQNVESAINKNVEFAHALIAFPNLPPELRQEGVKTLLDLTNTLTETLKLDVNMFLGPDGEPIEGPV